MKKIKTAAFSLLEVLVALFVLSGSVLILSSLTKLFQQEIKSSQNDQTQDWQLFCTLLRYELAGASFDKVENNYLYITKNDKAIRLGYMPAGDFRKTNSKGQGYQPMLHDLKQGKISEHNQIIKITVTFAKGGERTFLYKFSDK